MTRTVLALRATTLLILAVMLCPAARAENWPRWRGPADNGSTDSPAAYPVKFDAANHVLWKVDLPGKGCSTPIVWQNHIYLTAPSDDQDAALAFDITGKPLWRTTLGPQRKGKNRNGSGCNPSPATDGQTLFVYFKSGALAALDLSSKVLWKTNLQERFGRDTLYWDVGTSPVLTAKDVVIAVMQNGGSYLAAFDKLTGAVHWKVAREYVTPTEDDHSYATPIVLDRQGVQTIVVWGAEHLTAHDAADGRLLWSCGGFNLTHHANWVCVASPVICGDIAILPYGRGAQLHGIKLGGVGDVTASNRLWERDDTGAFVSTPAEYKGRVYVLRDRKAQLECIDAQTGKTDWAGALPHAGGDYYASPTIAGGNAYLAREDGKIFVARIAGGFELLSENDMGEKIIASPVPIDGKLLLRGESHLFCVGEK